VDEGEPVPGPAQHLGRSGLDLRLVHVPSWPRRQSERTIFLG
jgi:hypothetical protein